MISVLCGAGEYRYIDHTETYPDRCRKCPIGSYNTADMAQDVTSCVTCGDPGYWKTETAGATSREQCRCMYQLLHWMMISTH